MVVLLRPHVNRVGLTRGLVNSLDEETSIGPELSVLQDAGVRAPHVTGAVDIATDARVDQEAEVDATIVEGVVDAAGPIGRVGPEDVLLARRLGLRQSIEEQQLTGCRIAQVPDAEHRAIGVALARLDREIPVRRA